RGAWTQPRDSSSAFPLTPNPSPPQSRGRGGPGTACLGSPSELHRMPAPPVGPTASLAGAERREPICDRFEAAWQAGSPLRVEDLLAEVPEPERDELFVALMRVELEYRPAAREAAVEYRARFPAFAALVDSLLRDPAETQWLLTPGGDGWVP